MVQREMEFSALLNERMKLGALPPYPRGFRGIGGSPGYSNKKEVEKLVGVSGQNIRRSLIRLSLDGSLPSVARLCFTG